MLQQTRFEVIFISELYPEVCLDLTGKEQIMVSMMPIDKLMGQQKSQSNENI